MTTTTHNGKHTAALRLPASARPHLAEEQTISACLALPHIVYLVRDEADVRWQDFSGDTTRALAHAIWNLVDPEVNPTPKPVDRGTVVMELERLGYWETTVPAETFQRLWKHGTPTLAASVLDFAPLVRDASLARYLADLDQQFVSDVLAHPSDTRGYAATHAEAITRAITHRGGQADHSLARFADDDERDVPGIYTGVSFFDLDSGGFCEGETIGLQSRQKGGKTRTALELLLRPILTGVPTVILTTDGHARILRKRFLVLIATANMLKAKVDPHELTLNPKYLSPKHLSATQQHYLRQASQQFDERTAKTLVVLDATDGVQEFTVGFQHLYRYIKPPFNARLWMYDHIANVSNRGARNVEAFSAMVDTLKIENVRWQTTGIIINQKSEAGNRDGGGGGFGSYMGGALPAAVDTLYQPFTAKRVVKEADASAVVQTYGERFYDKTGELFFRYTALHMTPVGSRWSDDTPVEWEINPSSGHILERYAVPHSMAHARDQLPYIRHARGQWDVATDGDPWQH